MARGIYRIENTVNGKFYVGSSVDTRKRFKAHKGYLRRGNHHNAHLQCAWNKYGKDAFKFRVIRVVYEDEDLQAIEQTWLDECVGQPDCYNISKCTESPTRGRVMGPRDADTRRKISKAVLKRYAEPDYKPRKGFKHSEETRAKISEAVQAALAEGRGGKFIPTAETRAKMSASLMGNTCAQGAVRSEEQRKAISERMKGNQQWLGKTHSAESRAKMGKAVVELYSGKRFPTMKSAAKHYGMPGLATIIRSIKTGNPVSTGPNAGLRFAYEGDEVELPEQEYPPTRKQAQEQGSKYYFTGKPCVRGHVAPRVTKGTCTECQKEDWRKQNEQRAGQPKSEAAKAAGRRYYEKIKAAK